MEKINLNEYLASNEYPGRGIAVAMAPDGRQMFIGYFIMGRSENSRNRVFDPVPERGGICLGITCVVDRTKPEAPSPIPILASALKLDLPNYTPEECPICKEGKLPLVHLGSRKMKQEAKQTL